MTPCVLQFGQFCGNLGSFQCMNCFLLSGMVLIKTKRCDVDTDRVAWSDSLYIPTYPLVMLILIGRLVR